MSKSVFVRPRLFALESREMPAVVDLFAVSSGAGIEARVQVRNADGSTRFDLVPFPGFTGGSLVSTGDVNGDEVEDIAVAAGSGGGPHVKVFDGISGAEIRSFFAFDPAFRGGASIGLGDVTGDKQADVVVGAGEGGGPHVKVFDGATGAEIRSFFAFEESFRGGVAVRAGDVSGDGLADIVTGAGPGGGPHVKVFDATTLAEIQSFFGGDPNDRGGAFVGVADFLRVGSAQVTASARGAISAPGYIEQDNAVLVSTTGRVPVAAVRQTTDIIAILIGAAPTIRDGTSNIVDGTSNIVVGLTAIKDGTSNIQSRIGALNVAIAQIANAAQVVGLTNAVSTGLNLIRDGTSNIASSAGSLEQVRQQVAVGTRSIKDGTSNIGVIAVSLTNGIASLTNGLASVNSAFARAGVSTAAIRDGTSNIAIATAGIRDGTSNISSGVSAVNAALGGLDAILVSGSFGDSFAGGVFVG
jgi:hypothetical protein